MKKINDELSSAELDKFNPHKLFLFCACGLFLEFGIRNLIEIGNTMTREVGFEFFAHIFNRGIR